MLFFEFKREIVPFYLGWQEREKICFWFRSKTGNTVHWLQRRWVGESEGSISFFLTFIFIYPQGKEPTDGGYKSEKNQQTIHLIRSWQSDLLLAVLPGCNPLRLALDAQLCLVQVWPKQEKPSVAFSVRWFQKPCWGDKPTATAAKADASCGAFVHGSLFVSSFPIKSSGSNQFPVFAAKRNLIGFGMLWENPNI